MPASDQAVASPNRPTALDIRPSAASFDDEAGQDIELYGIAGRTWEAARLLEPYLCSADSGSFAPSNPLLDPSICTVLELGSGTGFLGLRVARRLRADQQLVLTDLTNVCPLLERNVSAARLQDLVLVRSLPWGDRPALDRIIDELDRIDLVLCADLVYFPELFAPLLRSLIEITSTPPAAPVVFAYQSRTLAKETPFFNALGAWFDLEPVQTRSDAGWVRVGADRSAFVWIAQRRPSTLDTLAPASDTLLLSAQLGDSFELALLGDMSF